MSGPVRMLVLGSRWPPESFLARLFRGLSGPDFQIWLAAGRRFKVPEPHIHRHPMPSGALGRLQRPFYGLWERRVRGAPRLPPELVGCLRRRWDLLYFPWNSAAVACLPLMAAGIPSLVSCRGSQILVAPHGPRREGLVREFPTMFERATRVHCVSQDILQASVQLGLDESKARVIPPAVDPDRFRPSERPREEPAADSVLEVLGVGSLIWRKGFEDALSAVALTRDRGLRIRYHLVGDGPDRQRLRFTARDLGLEDAVVFHGACSTDEILALMRRCRVFLLSSVCEGISNAALEAMACGMAVVSTRCGGMAEAIDAPREGLLVPSRDPGAMAEALARLAGDSSLRAEMGRQARRRVEKDFRLEDQISAFRELCLGAITAESSA